MTMTDQDHATLVTASHQESGVLRGPRFMPLDFVAFIMIVVMIWGPLLAGAMRQH